MATPYNEALFGTPRDFESSKVVVLPVPWEVTTSYGGGTSKGPEAVLKASPQLDLFDVELGSVIETGFHFSNQTSELASLNEELKKLSTEVIKEWDETCAHGPKAEEHLTHINNGSQQMVDLVKAKTQEIISAGKVPGVLGGDHSSPLGAIQAIGEKYKGDYGVLHIDAHADLRKSYQGFQHSHASIMRNVMEDEFSPKILVQAGIRDFCEEEWEYICDNEDRIYCYFDHQLKSALFSGTTWHELCEDLIEPLPKNVYISLDIDGLSPEFCPGTGTPVPGGLSFDHMVHLLSLLGHSGRKVVGFDLCEVAPSEGSEWDGNVGARLLFKLCGWAAVTNGHYEIG